MIKQLVFFGTIFLCLQNAVAQKIGKSAITSIELSIKSYANTFEKADVFVVNLEALNGWKSRKYITTDKNASNISWNKFDVEVRGCGAVFDNGKLRIVRNYVDASSHEVKFRISPKNNPSFVREQSFSIPYIDSIFSTGNPQRAYKAGEFIDLSFLSVHYTNGRVLPLSAIPAGDRVKVFFVSGNVNQAGSFCMPGFNKILQPQLLVYAMLIGKSNYFTPFNVQYDFRRADAVNVSGERGANGGDGLNGRSGRECRSGESGTNGQYGNSGSNGKDLDVYLKKVQVNDTILLVNAIVKCNGEVISTQYFDPKYSVLELTSHGGNGGTGGDGGDGGYGSDNENRDRVGNGGDGGNGGNGGSGGDGGKVRVYVMESEKDISTALRVRNNGGIGGEGGKHGKKGRGGYSPNAKTVDLLLGTYAGRPGSEGSTGNDGRNGGMPEIIIVDRPTEDPEVRAFKEWY